MCPVRWEELRDTTQLLLLLLLQTLRNKRKGAPSPPRAAASPLPQVTGPHLSLPWPQTLRPPCRVLAPVLLRSRGSACAMLPPCPPLLVCHQA